MDEARGVVVGERRERDRRRVRLASAPAWTAREELGASGADDEHRHSGRPVDEVVDEVEQAVVRPVEILEDEHERASLCERFQEPPPGGERLGLAIASHVLRLGQADERPEMALDPLPVGRAFQHLRDDAAEPLLHLIRRVGLEDARVGFHHLA